MRDELFVILFIVSALILYSLYRNEPTDLFYKVSMLYAVVAVLFFFIVER